MSSPTEPFEKKTLYQILRFILYALLFTPLWVFSAFLFPFITSKVLYFRILVEIALAVYVVLVLQIPQLRPRWNWLLRAVWIYLGVVFLMSIFGVDFGKSMWGTIERGEGIVTVVHFAIYFTILSAVFQTKKEWRRYLFAALFIITFTAVYGLVQLRCVDPITGVQLTGQQSTICGMVVPTTGTRIAATIGNASFFAAFLIFGLALALQLLLDTKTWKVKLFLWAAFLFQLYILYETQTRGALLAVGLAFFIYLVFSLFKAAGPRWKILSAGVLGLLVVAGIFVYVNRRSPWVLQNRTLYRLATISSQDVTTQSRLDTWRASWRGWQDRFWIGYGYENYNVAFNKYFPAQIFKKQGSQIWFDRGHNVIFDVGVTSGIFGLLAYLGIFGVAGWFLVKLYRHGPESLKRKEILLWGLLLLAYFFQNLFVFDTQATYLMFFLALAYVAFMYNLYTAPELAEKSATANGQGYPIGFFPIAVLALATIGVIYLFNIRPAQANLYTTEGIILSNTRSYRDVKPAFQRALSYGTYMDQEIRQKIADLAYGVINSGELSNQEQSDFFQFTTDELKKSIKESPRDVKNYLYLMSLLNQFPQNAATADEVLSLGETAVRLSPTRPQIYYETGQAYFYKKNYDAGLAEFRKAVDLNPEPKESHINYLLAGIVANRQDVIQSETKYLIDTLHYKFTSQDYVGFARAYFQGGNIPMVIESYKTAISLDPKNSDLYAKLAAAYGQACDLQNARLALDQMLQIDSSLQAEANNFYQQLVAQCKK